LELLLHRGHYGKGEKNRKVRSWGWCGSFLRDTVPRAKGLVRKERSTAYEQKGMYQWSGAKKKQGRRPFDPRECKWGPQSAQNGPREKTTLGSKKAKDQPVKREVALAKGIEGNRALVPGTKRSWTNRNVTKKVSSLGANILSP